MATKYPPYQSAVPTCQHHPDEELNFFCCTETCKKRVCEECCKDNHKDHDWRTAKKVARDIRKNSTARCEKVEEMILGLGHEKEEEAMEADIKRIEKLRIKYNSVIDDIAERMKAKRRGGRVKRDTNEDLDKLKKMLNFYSKEIHAANDNVALEVEEEFHIQQENISSVESGKKILKFKQGTLSPDVLEHMFGDVVEDKTESKVKVTEMSHFTHVDNSDYIQIISPVGKDEALIRRYKSNQMDHVDMRGRVIKERKIPTNFSYFISIDNDIVYTLFGSKIVSRVSSSGTVSDVYSTAPLRPSGICTSRDGGYLVCLCDCKVSAITPDSRGEVHHIDSSGVVLRKYNHTEDQKNKLFINPIRISQNMNKDLCVVEWVDKEFRSRLVIVSVKSKLISVYTGQSALKEKFTSNDVCCDYRGRIIVTDYYNNAVHLLREDGHFLQYILMKQSPLCEPRSLGLHGDTLWVGCEKGVVRVYKYNDGGD